MTRAFDTAKTTTYDKDGNVSGVQQTQSSPVSDGQAIGGTGSGVLGALVGAANFVYNVLKDYGAAASCNIVEGGAGVSSGTADDAKFTATFVGEFRIAGVWYTHTRSYGSLLKQHRGSLPHERTKKEGDFSSAYLCTIFPYELSWNLYKVTPKAASRKDTSAAKFDRETRTQQVLDDFMKKIASYKIKPGDLVALDDNGKPLRKNGQPVAYRAKLPNESFDSYIDFLRQFTNNDYRIGQAIDTAEAGLDAIGEEQAESSKQQQDVSTALPFYVMRNIRLTELSEHGPIKAAWSQAIKVDSTFTITPRSEKPYGFRLSCKWGEKTLAYGYPGNTGYFEVTQAGENETDVKITSNGKLGRRFEQFKTIKKI